jgi:hypothetical protein
LLLVPCFAVAVDIHALFLPHEFGYELLGVEA